MSPFLYLVGGAAYGALVVVVSILIGKSIYRGRGPEPAPAPEVACEAAPEDAGIELLADEPVEVLSDAEVDARFREILRPEFTWERWL